MKVKPASMMLEAELKEPADAGGTGPTVEVLLVEEVVLVLVVAADLVVLVTVVRLEETPD
jgi:hypothetical protein